MMSESLRLHVFVLSHILHWWLQLLCKHNKWWLTAVRSMWTTALTELSQQLVWAACSCLHKVIYLGAQECELQQNGMRLTHTVFFIMAELYIRAVTESFIRSDVIALSPMSLQLFPRLWPVFPHARPQKWDSCECTPACVPLPSSVMLPRVRRSHWQPPHPSSALSMPITGQYNCQRSLRTDSLQ